MRILFHTFCILLLSACGSEQVNNRQPNGDTVAVGESSEIYFYGNRNVPTRYPIVLAHGLMAGETLFDYGHVAQVLESAGYRSITVEVIAVAGIADRGDQLAQRIDDILREEGVEKVNIIAHSMGGLDARYVISTLGYGDRIASLTTISTPHRGSEVADFAISRPFFSGWARILNWIAAATNGSTSRDQADAYEAIYQLQTNYVQDEFNPDNPDDPNVYYQSFAGSSQLGWRAYAPTRTTLRPFYRIISRRAQQSNDGLVANYSARWGNYRGALPADHFAVLPAGARRWHRQFNWQHFYVGVASELGQRGF